MNLLRILRHKTVKCFWASARILCQLYWKGAKPRQNSIHLLQFPAPSHQKINPQTQTQAAHHIVDMDPWSLIKLISNSGGKSLLCILRTTHYPTCVSLALQFFIPRLISNMAASIQRFCLVFKLLTYIHGKYWKSQVLTNNNEWILKHFLNLF